MRDMLCNKSARYLIDFVWTRARKVTRAPFSSYCSAALSAGDVKLTLERVREQELSFLPSRRSPLLWRMRADQERGRSSAVKKSRDV